MEVFMTSHFQRCLVLLLVLVPAFAIEATAQRRNPADTRRAISNDTFRELMNKEREGRGAPDPKADLARAVALKQLREDFVSIQAVNNKMMAQAWATENIDYERTSLMLNEINDKAVRLKNNLSLPQPEKIARQNLSATSLKEFKSALLVMDRSLMSFVNNPIFHGLVEVNSGTQATQDLENVIAYSAKLRKIAAYLKTSQMSR